MNTCTDRSRELSDEARLEEQVGELLARSPYWELRKVSCSARGTKVVLTGTVSSFYYKQLAQSQLRPQLAATISLENQLEVAE